MRKKEKKKNCIIRIYERTSNGYSIKRESAARPFSLSLDSAVLTLLPTYVLGKKMHRRSYYTVEYTRDNQVMKEREKYISHILSRKDMADGIYQAFSSPSSSTLKISQMDSR